MLCKARNNGFVTSAPPPKIPKKIIYRYALPDIAGYNYRFWDNTNGPNLDPLQWSGPLDNNGFPLPTANPPTIQGISNDANLRDNAVPNGIAARYGIIDGYIILPEGSTHVRDANANTGELGMVLYGNCCGGDLTEAEGGNHSGGQTDSSLMEPTAVSSGVFRFYSPQSDLSAFQGLFIQYSVSGDNGPWITPDVRYPEIPQVEFMEIDACDLIPEGWSLLKPKECCEPLYSTSGGGAAQTLNTVTEDIYEEFYFAKSTDGLSESSNRNMTITRSSAGRWTALFSTPHPDGVNYHPSMSAEEEFTNRDGAILQIEQGTLTANGFSYYLITGDNGGAQDVLIDSPHTISIAAPTSVITEATLV